MSVLEDIARLGSSLLDEPVQNVNTLAPLINCVEERADSAAVLEAIQTLRVYFVEALHNDAKRISASEQGDAAAQLLSYIRGKLAQFEASLVGCLRSDCPAKLQLAATLAFMDTVRSEQVGSFNDKSFVRLLNALLLSKHVASEVIATFLHQFADYADVRYYILKWIASTAGKLAGSESKTRLEWQDTEEDVLVTLFDMLSAVPVKLDFEADGVTSWCGGAEAGLISAATLPGEGSRARRKRKLADTEPSTETSTARCLWATAKAQRHVYSKAWLAFLRNSLPEDVYKRLLQILTEKVLPNLTNPILLSDFLTTSIDRGGLVGILSLHGLFTLVTRHGFEYPAFYTRLYTLLTPQVFTAKYRLKFLQLTDIFLASSLVPAYTAAAFAKRFARIALTAPPFGATTCIAFIHNLIRRHPSCMCLIHRPGEHAGTDPGADPYDADCGNPALSRAVESSLWELQALRVHQSSAVSNFVQHLDRDLTDRKRTAEADMGALLPENYHSQLTAELEKKLRRPPSVAFYAVNEAAPTLGQALPGWDVYGSMRP